MNSLVRDIRFTLRLLLKNPAFTLVAILTLGLGIGVSSAIFSVISAVLLRPLPYPEPERLVQLFTQFPAQKFDRFWVSPPEFSELSRELNDVFDKTGAYAVGGANLGGLDRPVRVQVAYVTHGLLPTLGVNPKLGRFLAEEEDRPGDPTVVLLSHGLWSRAFAADPSIVGRTLLIDALPIKVVGVMPKGFAFPQADTDIWLPLCVNLNDQNRRGNHFLSVIGRLHKGGNLAFARARMDVFMEENTKRFGMGHALSRQAHPLIAHGVKAEMIAPVRPALLVLQGAVALVLLICCVNLSNLLLARSQARSRELAMRAVLGASHGRLMRQLLTESAVLGILGAGAGLLLCVWLFDPLVAMIPEQAPRTSEVRIDLGVVCFSLVTGVVASLLTGLSPILHLQKRDLHGAVKSAGLRVTDGTSVHRFRRGLVISEIALSVLLVAGAGLLLRTFATLQRVDLGFQPDGLVTFEVELPEKTYPTHRETSRLWTQLMQRLSSAPGVQAATLMSGLPPFRRIDANDMILEGKTQNKDGPVWNIDFWQVVWDGYFQTMGIRLVAGRFFTAADHETAPPVVLINEAMARRFFPGENPLGKRLKVSPTVDWQTIVGVVADVKQQGLEAPTGTELYLPLRQMEQVSGRRIPRLMNVTVRAKGDPRGLSATLRTEVASLDPNLPVARLRTLDQVLYEALARPRFLAVLLTLFSLLALSLAAVGIYGVMAYLVLQRTPEIGIRMALGARPTDVRKLILLQGLRLAGFGVVVGLLLILGLNFLLGPMLSSILFGVPLLDPVTLLCASLVALGTALLACYVPASRATKIDPMVALRVE